HLRLVAGSDSGMDRCVEGLRTVASGARPGHRDSRNLILEPFENLARDGAPVRLTTETGRVAPSLRGLPSPGPPPPPRPRREPRTGGPSGGACRPGRGPPPAPRGGGTRPPTA